MPKNRKRTASSGDRELLGMFVATIGFMIGYFVAEASLARYAHPVHWIASAAAALVGYVVAIFIYSRVVKSRKP